MMYKISLRHNIRKILETARLVLQGSRDMGMRLCAPGFKIFLSNHSFVLFPSATFCFSLSTFINNVTYSGADPENFSRGGGGGPDLPDPLSRSAHAYLFNISSDIICQQL